MLEIMGILIKITNIFFRNYEDFAWNYEHFDLNYKHTVGPIKGLRVPWKSTFFKWECIIHSKSKTAVF